MTDCLNAPVVTVPLMVTIGTGANTGHLDFNIDPEDLNPPDEEFWKDKEWFSYEKLGYGEYIRCQGVYFHVPSTKAHAKMLIHLLTGRTDLWKSSKEESTISPNGQGGTVT